MKPNHFKFVLFIFLLITSACTRMPAPYTLHPDRQVMSIKDDETLVFGRIIPSLGMRKFLECVIIFNQENNPDYPRYIKKTLGYKKDNFIVSYPLKTGQSSIESIACTSGIENYSTDIKYTFIVPQGKKTLYIGDIHINFLITEGQKQEEYSKRKILKDIANIPSDVIKEVSLVQQTKHVPSDTVVSERPIATLSGTTVSGILDTFINGVYEDFQVSSNISIIDNYKTSITDFLETLSKKSKEHLKESVF